ncbi:unnamed protein product [Durusdinium trenchii]|uniref:Uncharacterized protein n=1 Tax=Durusdinium trenchii TaxID=1381693 RepID=A0ABP0Q2D5_9DINO
MRWNWLPGFEAVRCAPTEPLPPTVETKLGQAKSAQEKLGDLVKRLKGEADPARQKELELQEVLKAKERAETLLKALKVEKGLLEEQLGTARTEARMAKEEAIQAKERAAEAMATARKAEVQMQTIKTKAEEEVKAAKNAPTQGGSRPPSSRHVREPVTRGGSPRSSLEKAQEEQKAATDAAKKAEEAKLKAERSVEELKQKALSDKDATAQGLQKKLDDALRAKAAAEASVKEMQSSHSEALREAEEKAKAQRAAEEERSKKKDLELKSLREDLEQLRNQLKDRDKQLRAVTEQVATINNSWAQHVEALHEKYQAT